MEAFLEKRQYDSDFRVWTCCYKNLNFLPHYHREMEIIYLREGNTHIGMNNRTYSCHKGDLIICQSGDMHYNNVQNEENVLDFIIFDPSVLNKVYSNQKSIQTVATAKELRDTGMDKICNEMFHTVHHELKYQEEDYDLLIQFCLAEFWVKYTRYFGRPKELSDNQPFHTSISKLEKLMDYIDANYANEITLTQAAQIMGYEPCHCSKVFKKLTGVNFTEYVNNVKIGKAIEKIRNSGTSMTEIAMESGFNNIRTFNRVFKNITHMTPTEFVKTNRVAPSRSINAGHQSHMTSTIVSYGDSWQ